MKMKMSVKMTFFKKNMKNISKERFAWYSWCFVKAGFNKITEPKFSLFEILYISSADYGKAWNHYYEEVIPVHQHEMSDWEVTVPSTCSKGGKAIRHCLGCDFTEETDLMPDSSLHNYELDSKTKPGYVLDKCTICGHVKAEYVDKPNKD